jgi:Flp pilus assembly protein TadD
MRSALRAKSLLLLAAVSMIAACASRTAPTPEEAALIEDLGSKSITPATAEARAEIRGADPVTRSAFWAAQYDNNPADLEAAIEFARVTRAMGRPSQAAAIANTSLALRPNNAELLTELGAALVSDGRAAAATQPLTRAVELAPDDPRIRNLLGAALDHNGDHERARAQYARALELMGDDAAVLSNYAMSYTLSGDPESAETLLRRAIVLPGANGRVRQNLALALALQGKFDEAERLAQQDLPREVAMANVSYVRTLIERPRTWGELRGVSDD